MSERDITITLEKGTDIRTIALGVSFAFVVIKHSNFQLVSTVSKGPSPQWINQSWNIDNIQAGEIITLEVWHESVIGENKLLQTGSFTIPEETCEKQEIEIALRKASDSLELGMLTIKLDSKPANGNGDIRTCCRFVRHSSSLAGVLTVTWSDRIIPTYNVYELKLRNVPQIFDNVQQHWNIDYENAQKIFSENSQSARRLIKSQHNYLYNARSSDKTGYIHCAQDFFELINYGIRGGIPRFFTYALMEDGMYFSESSTEFTRDFFSKHAMHSNCSEAVYYAGEFLIYTDPDTNESKLVIDNNSGTFSPAAENLPKLLAVFNFNIPDLTVEVYDRNDPQLVPYTKELVDKTR